MAAVASAVPSVGDIPVPPEVMTTSTLSPTAADRAVWVRARAFTDEAVPQMNDYWDRAEYPLHLVKRMGDLDLLSDGLAVPGGERAIGCHRG